MRAPADDRRKCFNPRPPRGGRPRGNCLACWCTGFNPRPPRGGRRSGPRARSWQSSFNPRPPRGGRLTRVLAEEVDTVVSIHALRVEGDSKRESRSAARVWFQSTPSAWRATSPSAASAWSERGFNPRPPRGGRPCYYIAIADPNRFQSTPSAWRATFPRARRLRWQEVSIHALRVEGDTAARSPA